MNYFDKAHRTARWICDNQHVNSAECVPDKNDVLNMVEDMNFGRFVRNYKISERRVVHYSTNWISGMTIYGLALLYDYFKEERYFEAGFNGSFYLCALQNTIDPEEDAYGAFNERTTVNRWLACRDGLSAAWGLLRLFHSNGKKEFLRRAEIFAEWHMEHAMRDNFPIAYYMFDSKASGVYDFVASCQGGSALFFWDLYELTGKESYRETMLKIVDLYMEYFFNEDGSLDVIYDPQTGKRGNKESNLAWSDMHKFNDDFGALGILSAYNLTGDQKYLNFTVKYLEWVMDQQQDDGSFGKYGHAVSSCVAALNLANIHLITGREDFKNATHKALKHLEQNVVNAPGDPVIDGAVLGMEVCDVSDDMISLRVTMYTMYVYLLMGIIENNSLEDIPEKVINNPMLIGLRYRRVT
jgi:rhamnogalacturonyl hydrolase YesR